eukprot:15142034-Alexandrium_andersonii.AAC.1
MFAAARMGVLCDLEQPVGLSHAGAKGSRGLRIGGFRICALRPRNFATSDTLDPRVRGQVRNLCESGIECTRRELRAPILKL